MDDLFNHRRNLANVPLTDPDKNRIIGNGAPRFELYHFALSVCSQKVRTCLAEKDVSYIAHDINIQPGNYHPDYIRLRLLGQAGRSMARGYTGRSSVESEGFDPAVVPTLLDLEQAMVLVDSVKICAHVDAVCAGGTKLIPATLKQSIDSEIAIVDATPHVAILYGAHPDGDFRPERIRSVMPGVHDRKIAKLQQALEQARGDPEIEAAIEAKISKERAGKSHVARPEAMRASVDDIIDTVAALNDRLDDARRWVCGEVFTMADVQWAVSLFRLKWIGMAFCWTGGHTLNTKSRPNVERYASRLFDRQSFREAVIHWPGVPRSEYVMEHYRDES
ncbi:MAG: glutathione S-transferase family protein [Alphaproteobacteria bacterium]|nr:glutathione S-transferase family protein [Alphaproteobacteria bacterium]